MLLDTPVPKGQSHNEEWSCLSCWYPRLGNSVPEEEPGSSTSTWFDSHPTWECLCWKPGPGAPKGIPDSGWRPKEALQSLLFPVGLEMKSHPFLFRFNPSQYIKNKFLHSIRREKANSHGGLPWWYRGRIGTHLPMQGTQVRSLIWKDSTGRGVPQLLSPSSRALEPQLLKSLSLASVLPNRGSHCKRSPSTAINSSPRSP